MPREFCVGNGNLLVNFDNDLNIRDMYFPFVGMENHVSGHFCRFGVWVDGRFSWIDDSWDKRLSYKEDSLVTNVSLKNRNLSLELKVEDLVNHFHDVFLRKVTVKNVFEEERTIVTNVWLSVSRGPASVHFDFSIFAWFEWFNFSCQSIGCFEQEGSLSLALNTEYNIMH